MNWKINSWYFSDGDYTSTINYYTDGRFSVVVSVGSRACFGDQFGYLYWDENRKAQPRTLTLCIDDIQNIVRDDIYFNTLEEAKEIAECHYQQSRKVTKLESTIKELESAT